MTAIRQTTTPLSSIPENRKKGSYVLIMTLAEEQTIGIGRLGSIWFPDGCYAYVGSAMAGLKPRLDRHLRRDKKKHWHIDYLLPRATISGVIIAESEARIECQIARLLNRHYHPIPGFGCSDCRCPSHLFFAPDENQMKSYVMSSISLLGIPPTVSMK